MNSFTQTDFSGGITDNYLSCAPNCYYRADNFSIDVNGKLNTRYGTLAYDTRVPTSGSSTRVSGIYLGNEPFGNPMVCRGDSLYMALSGSWTSIAGIGGNAPLANKTALDVESAVIWRKQLILCSACTTTNVTTTGTIPQTYAITQGGITTYYGVTIVVASASGIAVNQTVTGNGIPANTIVTGVAGTTITISALAISGTGIKCIFASSAVMPSRVVCTDFVTPTYSSVTLGLPQIRGSSITCAVPPSGTNVYNWLFYYTYTFTDYQGTVFEDRGPVFYWPTTIPMNTPIGGGGSISFTGIPVLANNSTSNYDTANIKVNICRTISNGQAYYIVGQVTNGTTTFTDNVTDATLLASQQAYTNGNVLSWEQPPIAARYVTVVNDFFWWATDTFLTQSNPGAPGGCPSSFYSPLQQKIRGLSDIVSFPVVFCDRSVYRIDGQFDELGNGGFIPYEISQTAGCLSNKSIVKIPGGLVWAGNGGFYWTDGYQVKKISFGLDQRYPTWKNQFISGAYDSIRNIVVWTISSAANSNTFPCDSFAVLHLRYGITETSVFTNWSSQNNIFPTSLAFSESLDVASAYQAKLLICDARGFFLYQDPLAYTDPHIDLLVYPTSFKKKAIIYRLESAALDLGSDAKKKYCVDMTAELSNDTDLAVQFITRRDDGGPWGTFSDIRSDIPPTTSNSGGSGTILWDLSQYGWNDTTDLLTHDWDSQSLVEGRRYFPKGTLRATRRQMGLTNAYTMVAISDVKGLASITDLRQITLASGFWPHYCDDYFIGIDPLGTGTYTYYEIKQRVSDSVITVYDPAGTFPASPTSTFKWQMQGYRKFERANLLSFTVNFDEGSNTQNPSHGTAGLINA